MLLVVARTSAFAGGVKGDVVDLCFVSIFAPYAARGKVMLTIKLCDFWGVDRKSSYIDQIAC